MATNMDLAVLGLEVRSDGVVVATRRLRDLQGQAGRTQAAASNLGNGIDSLVKKLFALVGAYQALHSAASFMERGLQFNSNLETSRIGIGTLITSMTQLADAQGNVLQGAEKYAAAQNLAAEMMKDIQRLGLETTATTETLVAGVQSILGPALQAGMALKDIPTFAVQGAQALQTLGVPLDQMRTELEALLSGNINKTQDILAPKLFADVQGELGEYIKGLRESGTLVQEIQKRLEPFGQAGKDIAQTWSALTSNFQEAMDTFAGSAAIGFADSMKQSVGKLSDLILTTEKNSIGLSKEFSGIAEVVKVIESTIGQGVLSATERVVSAVRSLGQYINEVGADRFLADIGLYAETAAAGLVTVTLARKAATAQFVISNGVEQQSITGLGNYTAALYRNFVALRQQTAAAKEEMVQAQASLAAYREHVVVRTQQIAATRGQAAAEQYLSQAMVRQTLLTQAATAAEERYAAAAAASSLVAKTAAAAKAAFSGLLAMFGGPVGLAVTALIAGTSLLALRTSETTLATKALTEAEQAYANAVKASTDETGKLTEKLSASQKLKYEIAQKSLQDSLNQQFSMLEQSFSGIFTSSKAQDLLPEDYLDIIPANRLIPDEYLNSLQDMISGAKEGRTSVEELANGIAALRQKAIDAGYAESEFVKQTEAISRNDGVLDALDRLSRKLIEVQERLQDTAETAHVVSSSMSAMGAALQEAITKSSLNAYIAGLGKKEQSVARGLVTDLKLTEQQVKDVFSGKAIEGLEPEGLKKYVDNMNKIWEASQVKTKRSSAGSTKSASSAGKAFSRIIDDLNKKVKELQTGLDAAGSTQYWNGVTAELENIDRRMKESKGTKEQISQIQQLRKEYEQLAKERKQQMEWQEEQEGRIQAAQATKKPFGVLGDVQDMTTRGAGALQASMQGIEAEYALAEKNFRDLMEKNYLTKSQYDEAMVNLEHEKNVKLRVLNGEMSATFQLALEEQYTALMDWKSTMADTFVSGINTASNALADFFLTGMRDTESLSAAFSKMVSSMISDLAQLFMKMIIIGTIKQAFGITGGGLSLEGLFGGGSASAKGNVFSGGNISDYSNSIVTQPTFFSGNHLSAYAKGGNVMGEKGPEVILPLFRDSQHRLGVNASVAASPVALDQKISVNVINNTDSQVTTKRSTDSHGNVNLEIMLDKMVGDAMRKPGSASYNALQSTWGGATRLAKR